VRLALAHQLAPEPQAILTLGGGHGRITFTAELAKAYPELDIWLSTGGSSLPSGSDGNADKRPTSIFQSRGIERSCVRIDRCATDTLTNFTCVVGPLSQQGIRHVLLLTDDTHMLRAQTIATIVLGSRGIAFSAVAIPTSGDAEPWFKIPRDAARALIWAFSGGLVTLAR